MAKQYLILGEYEMKTAADETGVMEGYASTFRNEDLQGDIVDAGAFARTIKKSKGKVPVLNSHMGSQMVGMGRSAVEDSKGLLVTAVFNLETEPGKTAYSNTKLVIAEGGRLGLSIGYGIPEGGSKFDEKKGVRHLTDIDLYEYSIAPVPANPAAGVTSVKMAGGVVSIREMEVILRDVGLTLTQAKRFLAEGYNAAFIRDVEAATRDAETSGKTIVDPAALRAEIRGLLLRAA